jgi:hypothetical protein
MAVMVAVVEVHFVDDQQRIGFAVAAVGARLAVVSVEVRMAMVCSAEMAGSAHKDCLVVQILGSLSLAVAEQYWVDLVEQLVEKVWSPEQARIDLVEAHPKAAAQKAKHLVQSVEA